MPFHCREFQVYSARYNNSDVRNAKFRGQMIIPEHVNYFFYYTLTFQDGCKMLISHVRSSRSTI
jgi:hypothetical protein